MFLGCGRGDRTRKEIVNFWGAGVKVDGNIESRTGINTYVFWKRENRDHRAPGFHQVYSDMFTVL